MSLQLSNLESILYNVDMFCENGFEQSHEDIYPIIEQNKKCSFNTNDRRRKFKNGHIGIVMNDEIMVKIVNFVSTFSKKPKSKTDICFIIYLFQNITQNNTSIFDISTKYMQNTLTNEDKIIIKNIINSVLEKSSINLKTHLHNLVKKDKEHAAPLIQQKRKIVYKRNNQILSILKEGNYKKYNEFTISEFFELIYQDLNKYPDVYNNIENFLKTKGMTMDELKNQNPQNCSNRGEELIMMTSFSLYKFNDIDRFVNIHKFCYCYPDIASLLISNKGGLFELNEANITNADKKMVGDNLGRYFNKNLEVLIDDINDLNNTIKHIYIDIEKDILKDSNFYHNDKLVVKDWKEFFNFMLLSFPNLLSVYNIKLIYDSSSNTLFELLGLYGYVCLDDDLSEMTNNSGTFFQTAQYCTGQLLYVFDKLKSIKAQNSSLWDKLQNTTIQNKTLKDLLKMIESTCIHGVGTAFLKFYMNAYESSLYFANIEKEKMNKDKIKQNSRVKPLPDDIEAHSIIDNIFQLAPFLIKAPTELYNTTKIKYLTCVSYDKTNKQLLTQNPLNKSYFVFGFTKNGDFIKIMYLHSHSYKEYKDYKSIENYFISTSTSTFTIKFYEGLTSIQLTSLQNVYMNNQNKSKNILDLIRIPHTFHKQRKHTFKVFADYTLNICQLMAAETTSKYIELAKLSKAKFYDIMSLEESSLIPKYMTVMKLDKPSLSIEIYKNAHMWNAKFEANTVNNGSPYNNNDYYVDSLQNILMLPYVYENNEAVVKTPYTNKDITKQYQIAQLLAKMLSNNTLNKVFIATGDDDIKSKIEQFQYFESYFASVHGQESEFRKNIFSDYQVDGVTIVTLNSDPSQAYFQNMKKTLFIFMCFYHYYLPEYRSFYRRATMIYKTSIASIKNAINASSLKVLQTTWANMLHDLIVSVCFEGCTITGIQYHFTELSKEYFLLRDIANTYKRQNGVDFVLNKRGTDDNMYNSEKLQNLIVMVKTLNEKFSYYNHEDLKLSNTIKKNDFSYYETIPRAQEYLTKIALIEEHAIRMNDFMIFEKLCKVINLDTRGKTFFKNNFQPIMTQFINRNIIDSMRLTQLISELESNYIWN